MLLHIKLRKVQIIYALFSIKQKDILENIITLNIQGCFILMKNLRNVLIELGIILCSKLIFPAFVLINIRKSKLSQMMISSIYKKRQSMFNFNYSIKISLVINKIIRSSNFPVLNFIKHLSYSTIWQIKAHLHVVVSTNQLKAHLHLVVSTNQFNFLQKK